MGRRDDGRHDEGSPSTSLRSTVDALSTALHDSGTRQRVVGRLSDAVVRGAVVGLSLRGGLHLASYLFGLLQPKRRRAGVADRPSSRELALDSLRYGAFVGSFGGVYVLADELIATALGKHRTRTWRAAASGALAGPTIMLTGPGTRHTSLALYILLRGLALLVRCGNLPTAALWKRVALAPTRWQHGDTFLVCLATMQIGYSWIVLPQTLPTSFVRFLNKHGGKPLYIYDALRQHVARDAAGPVPPGPLPALAGSPQAGLAVGATPCAYLHPGRDCSGHVARFFPAAYLRALPVYLPVYLVPSLLVHRGRLLGPDGPRVLRRAALGVLRSSAFLSLYCAFAWRGVCAGWGSAGRTTGAVIALSCWTAGLATLVEKKSRRMELGLYCISRAIESLALCFGVWGLVPARAVPRRLDVLMFAAAAAAICHCYSDHYGARRDVFRSKYLAVFDFVLGNTGFKSGSIRHAPSNLDLLASLEQRVGASGAPLARHLARSVASLTALAGGAPQPHEPGVRPVASTPSLGDLAGGGAEGADPPGSVARHESI